MVRRKSVCCCSVLIIVLLLNVTVRSGFSPCGPDDESCEKDFQDLRRSTLDSAQFDGGIRRETADPVTGDTANGDADTRTFFGTVLDIILGKDKEYQSGAFSPEIAESQLRAMEEDMNKVQMQDAELRRRRSELHRYIKETSSLHDSQRNNVVDQLVEDELERLEVIEWRLTRIRKRLQSYLKTTKALLEKQEL